MIEQHYARFLEAEASAQLRMRDAAGGAENVNLGAGLTDDAHKYATHGASLTVPSWNQLLAWLREMDLLRRVEAA